MPSKENRNSAAGTVPVLRKANRVFEFVARSPSGATAKSLAISLEIAPATCYRILRSFVADGWLRQSTSGAFELSFGLVPLLVTFTYTFRLIEATGTTDWGRLWAAALATGGTLLTTFAVVLTNHIPAAACTAANVA